MLVTQAIGLDLDELLTIYRVQFPVMCQYEADTWYDRTGRIVFTPGKGLVGVGLPRKARKADLGDGIRYAIDAPDRQETDIALGREDIQHLEQGTVTKTFPTTPCPAARSSAPSNIAPRSSSRTGSGMIGLLGGAG